MSNYHKPPATVVTGFTPSKDPRSWDRQPIYRIVELSRDGEGRLRQEGHVWHNDLDMVRRFGRAVAANTVSHRVMITDSQGDLIEELPVAGVEHRQSAWTSWGGIALPPAPPRVPKPRPEPPRTAVPAPAPIPVSVPVIAEQAPVDSGPPGLTFPPADTIPPSAAMAPVGARAEPPKDIPLLPVQSPVQAQAPVEAEAEQAASPLVPIEAATLP